MNDLAVSSGYTHAEHTSVLDTQTSRGVVLHRLATVMICVRKADMWRAMSRCKMLNIKRRTLLNCELAWGVCQGVQSPQRSAVDT